MPGLPITSAGRLCLASAAGRGDSPAPSSYPRRRRDDSSALSQGSKPSQQRSTPIGVCYATVLREPWKLTKGGHMPADYVFEDVRAFAASSRELRAQRRQRVISGCKEPVLRAALTRAERAEVLGKTGRRCHICGGTINGEDWQADHVLARASGGKHSVDNYLPAHSICNNYRWHYDPEEFQWILKIGVWMRTQIEKESPIGRKVAEKFCKKEKTRDGRRRPSGRLPP